MKRDYSAELERFTEHLRKIPEILAVCYTGSTAARSWDEYSDIDIDIVVSDKDYSKMVEKLPQLLSLWGSIDFYNNYKGSDHIYGFIGKEYAKVELDPIKLSQLKPHWTLKDIRIAFDKEGALTRVFLASKKEGRPELDNKEFVHFFLDSRSNFLYAARHYARGQMISGASELARISGDFLYYLGRIKGLEGYENLRTAEKHLTKKEFRLMKASVCKSFQRTEFRRALKANWEYMKYLEFMYERKAKRKLDLRCNDKEILNILRETLAQSK